MREEVVIRVDDRNSSGDVFICRFCFDGDHDSRLEAPCCCSGTIKFAHRDCVQRWCDEKGNTTCEICLQKFESGYTCPPKKPPPMSHATTIVSTDRGAMIGGEEENEHSYNGFAYYSIPNSPAPSFCRNLALIVTLFLLITNTFAVISGETTPHPSFPITVVVVAKACGIIIPMYVLSHIASVIETSIRQYYPNSEEEDEEVVNLTIHITR